MKRNDYIVGNVEKFVEWMSKRLDDGTFKHTYTSRRTRTRWSCESLFDAYGRYQWGYGDLSKYGLPAGSSFVSNLHVLQTLQNDLRAGLAAGDNERVRLAAIGVMKWGGVSNGNVKWLNDRRDSLCHIISRTRDAINAGDTEHPLFAEEDLRFTSGMSKVYALVCDDFVIYDSRVAATLGRAVVQFCQEHSFGSVPQGLGFPWAPAKSAPNAINRPQRNAGQAGLTFPRLTSGNVYAKWNMLANWLLNATVDHECTRKSAFARIESRTQRLRAMEAAMFMIGYDLGADSGLGSDSGAAVRPRRPADEGQAVGVEEVDEWVDCETGANVSLFEYRLGRDSIYTRRRDGSLAIRFPHSEIDDTLRILADRFNTKPFPLANSATKVRQGTAPFGLGTAYFMATRKNPPNTSRLGAVLEDIGVFEPCLNPPLPATHWTLTNIRLREDRGESDI
jgi:hypothetical protein